MEKIRYMKNESAFEYTVGMEIGLLDPIYPSKDTVRWYTIIKIEPLDGTYVGLMYLQSNQDTENFHTTILDNGMPAMYAELIDTISDRIVLP